MSLVKGKNIENDSIGASDVRLENNSFLRGRNAADSADISLIKANASDKPELASGAQVSGTPSSGNDIANKTYVDAQVSGAARSWNVEALTLSGTDITNQYKDLAQIAIANSIHFYFNGVWQRPTSDYVANLTGGTGGKTRLTFAGDLATGGQSALVSGDVIHIQYQY